MSVLDALQTALAAEHAAVHVLAALGARVPAGTDDPLRSALEEAYAEHRARRDVLVRFVRDEGGTPVAAEAAYALPAGPVAPAALALERGCAESYAWLVAHSVDDLRRWAVDALHISAIRGLALRGSPEIFPGADEYADR